MCLTVMERSVRTLGIYPAAETVVAVTQAVEEESRDVFNSNGEVCENAWDLPPAAETVVAVTRAVEEESRDVFNSNGEVYECLGFTPSSRDCGSATGCRGEEQGCSCRCAALLD